MTGRSWPVASERDLIERPLYNSGQPSRCQGPLQIVVPPFSGGAWLTLTDPPAVAPRKNRTFNRDGLDAFGYIASPFSNAQLGGLRTWLTAFQVWTPRPAIFRHLSHAMRGASHHERS